MKSTSSSRVYAYDNLKFFLIFCVVLGHLIQPYVGSGRFLKGTYMFIYTFHMPAFIFISGLFAVNTLKNGKKVLEKTVTFLVLYVLLKGFLYLLSYFCYHAASFDLFNEGGLPWFMLVLAAYYPIAFLTKKANRYAVLSISILIGCLIGYMDTIGDFLCLSRLFVFLPFFLLGTMTDCQKLLEVTKKPAIRVCSVFVLLATYGLAMLWPTYYVLRPILTGRHPYMDMRMYHAWGGILRMGCYILSMVLVLALISLVPRSGTRCSILGQRSMAVYFFHYAAIHPLRLWDIFGKFTNVLPVRAGIVLYCLLSIPIVLFFSAGIFQSIMNGIMRLCTLLFSPWHDRRRQP